MKCLGLAIIALLFSLSQGQAFEIPQNSSQVLVGIAEGWDSSYVTLTLYDKTPLGWKPSRASWKGRLGKNGLVWGKGLSPVPPGARVKTEGDMRSPAGVFDIGGAWGYAPTIQKAPSLSYVQVTSRDLWYEDPASPFYNQYRRIDREPKSAEEKKAQMKQDDYAHALKLFIAHNAYPNITPGAGSSIFFHIWRGGGSKPTAGCTTMDQAELSKLIAAMDPAKRPLYVLLPKADYDRYRGEWKLP
jgi:L,D-peptidoglycan transpeptidase YkuD (ErfK/YbiS/YcfS/YnhG family)